MRKLIFILVFALFSTAAWSHYPEISKVRSGFIQAVQQKEWRESYMILLEDMNHKENLHSKAYLGAAKTLVAECEFLPWTKYSYFKDGTRLIEEAIEAAPDNAEFKYLRFMVQVNAPAFLDYNAELEGDYKFIHSAIRNSTSHEVWMDHFNQFESSNKSKVNAALQTS